MSVTQRKYPSIYHFLPPLFFAGVVLGIQNLFYMDLPTALGTGMKPRPCRGEHLCGMWNQRC